MDWRRGSRGGKAWFQLGILGVLLIFRGIRRASARLARAAVAGIDTKVRSLLPEMEHSEVATPVFLHQLDERCLGFVL